jgi:predicted metal-dependent HD superfamily phosphohydrolase
MNFELALWERFFDQWKNLMQEYKVNNENVALMFTQINQRYAEGHRAYHNVEHILNSIEEFKTLRDLSKNPNELELAIIFHDIVYDTYAKDNEEKSAELMKDMLTYYVPRDKLDLTQRLILSTKHNKLVEDKDEQLIVSIDLAILGKSQGEYKKYSQAIRKEYSWVSDEEYKLGRKKVLNYFLSREKIYPNEMFFDKYERNARWNMIGEMERL